MQRDEAVADAVIASDLILSIHEQAHDTDTITDGEGLSDGIDHRQLPDVLELAVISNRQT
jgi:hypothetical protein